MSNALTASATSLTRSEHSTTELPSHLLYIHVFIYYNTALTTFIIASYTPGYSIPVNCLSLMMTLNVIFINR